MGKIKYLVDENYFDVIDTPNKAYILGLFCADGYNNEQRGTIVLNLQERDVDILLKIKTELKYEGNLTYDVKDFTRQNQYRLTITRKTLSKSLANAGCPQYKTKSLNFPELDDTLYSHYIRGFFDGDGWFCLDSRYNNKVATFGIIGLDNILFKIKNIFKINDIESTIYDYKKGKYTINNIRYLRCFNRKELIKLYSYLYKDAELFLERKHYSFKLFMDAIKSKK